MQGALRVAQAGASERPLGGGDRPHTLRFAFPPGLLCLGKEPPAAKRSHGKTALCLFLESTQIRSQRLQTSSCVPGNTNTIGWKAKGAEAQAGCRLPASAERASPEKGASTPAPGPGSPGSDARSRSPVAALHSAGPRPPALLGRLAGTRVPLSRLLCRFLGPLSGSLH